MFMQAIGPDVRGPVNNKQDPILVSRRNGCILMQLQPQMQHGKHHGDIQIKVCSIQRRQKLIVQLGKEMALNLALRGSRV